MECSVVPNFKTVFKQILLAGESSLIPPGNKPEKKKQQFFEETSMSSLSMVSRAEEHAGVLKQPVNMQCSSKKSDFCVSEQRKQININSLETLQPNPRNIVTSERAGECEIETNFKLNRGYNCKKSEFFSTRLISPANISRYNAFIKAEGDEIGRILKQSQRFHSKEDKTCFFKTSGRRNGNCASSTVKNFRMSEEIPDTRSHVCNCKKATTENVAKEGDIAPLNITKITVYKDGKVMTKEYKNGKYEITGIIETQNKGFENPEMEENWDPPLY